jgi:hypothetical protein
MITELELRETLARQAKSYDVPPPHDLMTLRAAALRRRRNIRLRFGGIAAAALLVASIIVGQLRLDQDDAQPVDRGLTEISDPRQLIATYGKIHVGWVLVYADGRVLSYPDHGPVYERRLTPSGIADVRDGSLVVDELVDVATSPAGVWVDGEAREFRPTAYAVCLWAGSNQPGRLRALPPAARNLLRGASPARAEHVVAESREDVSAWNCLVVDRADLVALEGIAARVDRYGTGDDIVFAGSPGSGVWASVEPMMPHGRWIAWGG